jgi:hypothetical protein
MGLMSGISQKHQQHVQGASNILGSILGYNMYQNPADAGKKYTDQIAGTITPYYQPYIDAGQTAMNTLMPQLQGLISDPAGMMNQMGSSFQQSPGYQYNVEQQTNAANQAAAAGGMVGSPSEQQALAGDISGIANQDYYNYLNHVLKMFSGGMQGMQGINQMGYGASNELAQSLANALMTQSKMAMAGAAGQNQATGGLIGGVTSGISDLF